MDSSGLSSEIQAFETSVASKCVEHEVLINPFMPCLLHIGQITTKRFLLLTDDRRLKGRFVVDCMLFSNHFQNKIQL